MNKSQSLIARYKKFLPEIYNSPTIDIISLGEGNTPLIKLNNFLKHYNLDLEVYVKFEGTNPTGSFKDRGMTAAITAALYNQFDNSRNTKLKAVVCASTGNTSAAAAAYAARAGLQSIVLLPAGKIALGKLVQAIVAGSKVIQINGNFDHAMELVKSFADSGEIAIVNSINPYRLHGQKTIAFEVTEQLNNSVPDYHCLPVGNAGNITAHWMGYTQYYNDKLISKKPKMLGYQAQGAAPFIAGHPIDNPETIATAIRIGNPQSWDVANKVAVESEGWFNTVTDQEILDTQSKLANLEGVFCEPASAASIAGLLKDYSNNRIHKGSTVVCTLTGHGLKDSDIILNNFDIEKNIKTINPDCQELLDAIG